MTLSSNSIETSWLKGTRWQEASRKEASRKQENRKEENREEASRHQACRSKQKATKKVAANRSSATKSSAQKSSTPSSFTGVIRGRSRPVQNIAKALRALVFEELPAVQETFYGGQKPMALYRTTADLCWIQPLQQRCNLYFMRGTELTDNDGILQGSSERFRYVKIGSTEDVEKLPLRGWLQESVALNEASIASGMSFDEVLAKMRKISRGLPDTKETVTWGKPHFRVGEKIFCGCGETRVDPNRFEDAGLRIAGDDEVAWH